MVEIVTASVLNKGPRKFGYKKKTATVSSSNAVVDFQEQRKTENVEDNAPPAASDLPAASVEPQVSHETIYKEKNVNNNAQNKVFDSSDSVKINEKPVSKANIISKPSHKPRSYPSLEKIDENIEWTPFEPVDEKDNCKNFGNEDSIQEMSLASLIASSFDSGELSTDEIRAQKRLQEAKAQRSRNRDRQLKDELDPPAQTVDSLGRRRESVCSAVSSGTAVSSNVGESNEFEMPMARPQLVLVNGQLAIDQSSLTVMREPDFGDADNGMGLPFVHDGDEEVKHITSASYGKKQKSQKWSKDETRDLYEGLQIFGTDFEMIRMVIFPYRTRAQVKNKFNKEERINMHRITFALTKRKAFSKQEHGHFAGADHVLNLN